jgi:ribonucleoside-diphosphate reductase alpha chain
MSTSVLDYIFRELAVSYLDRSDLAHAEPDDILPDTLGDGHREGDLPAASSEALVKRVTSIGYLRNRLMVLPGGAAKGIVDQRPATAQALAGAAAGEAVSVATTALQAVDTRVARSRKARLKGYEGDPCAECGNFTLLRNGTCLKCDTCGATSGCS